MKKILRILLLGILMLVFPAIIFARGRNDYRRPQPKPTPLPITKPMPPPVVPPTIPVPTSGLTLGAFNATVGTVQVAFDGWNDTPSCFAGQTTFIYWENYNVSLDSIISGSQDSVIKNFAAKICPNTILSLFHEMNLSDGSNDWAGFMGNNSPAKVVKAYQHIHDIIGNKVKYAWTINNSDYPSITANNPANYWPGSSYVDIIGEDGFQWSQGQTFAQALTPNLLILKSYATTYGKPLWVTSTAAQWDRANWITNAISWSKANGVSGLIYFDYSDGGNFTLTSSELSSLHL